VSLIDHEEPTLSNKRPMLRDMLDIGEAMQIDDLSVVVNSWVSVPQ
jgi:hypothetical protein